MDIPHSGCTSVDKAVPERHAVAENSSRLMIYAESEIFHFTPNIFFPLKASCDDKMPPPLLSLSIYIHSICAYIFLGCVLELLGLWGDLTSIIFKYVQSKNKLLFESTLMLGIKRVSAQSRSEKLKKKEGKKRA